MNRRLVAALISSAVVVTAAVVFIAVRSRTQPPRVCTAVACQSSVDVDLTSLPDDVRAAAKAATVCANGRCEDVTIWPGMPGASVKLSERTVRDASIRIRDERGTELLKLDLDGLLEAVELQPNGPDCGPTCWVLGLIAKDGVLERSPQQFGAPATSGAPHK